MTVHSLHLFDRAGTCLCYRDWGRPAGAGDAGNDRKNMFGMLFALRQFCGQLGPAGAVPGAGALRHFVASAYALHYLEAPTGLRFVLTTSRDFGPTDLVPRNESPWSTEHSGHRPAPPTSQTDVARSAEPANSKKRTMPATEAPKAAMSTILEGLESRGPTAGSADGSRSPGGGRFVWDEDRGCWVIPRGVRPPEPQHAEWPRLLTGEEPREILELRMKTALYKKLYRFQVEGVEFLWRAYCSGPCGGACRAMT